MELDLRHLTVQEINIRGYLLGSPTVVTTPVYLGGASVTKSGDPSKLAEGDVFTCNIGNWANNTNPNNPVTCEWSTSGPRTRATTYLITKEMLATNPFGVTVILRLSGNSQNDGYFITYYYQVPGGLETRSDITLYSKTFSK